VTKPGAIAEHTRSLILAGYWNESQSAAEPENDNDGSEGIGPLKLFALNRAVKRI